MNTFKLYSIDQVGMALKWTVFFSFFLGYPFVLSLIARLIFFRVGKIIKSHFHFHTNIFLINITKVAVEFNVPLNIISIISF